MVDVGLDAEWKKTCDADRDLPPDSMERLLRSNDCPLNFELQTIRGVISEAQKNLIELQSRINLLSDVCIQTITRLAGMMELVAVLRTKQEDIREFIAQRKKLTSPVRRLPMEVLHEIFVHTVESLSYQWEINGAGVNICNITPPQTSLWDILRVSQSWRASLLACSQAWSYITIVNADQFDATNYTDSRRIAWHLEYARQYPLAVVIFYDPQGGAPHDFPAKLMSSLLHYSNRIRHLHLCIPAAAFPQLHPLTYSWNSLHDLSIMPTSFSSLDDENPEDLPVVDAFSQAPNLSDIRLMQVLSESQFALPWQQVKQYRNTTWVVPKVEDILKLFTTATALETIYFDSDLDLPLERMAPLVTPPVLRSIVYVMEQTYCALPALFDSLSIPTLRHLELSTAHDDADPDNLVMPSILRMLERSNCSLEVLALAKMNIDSKDLERLGVMMTELEELWLTNVGLNAMTNDILQKMIVTTDDTAVVLFPNLRELDLEGEWAFDAQIFAEMVKSRWELPLPRRLWSIGVDWRNPAEICALLQEYKDNGLSLTVESGNLVSEDEEDQVTKGNDEPQGDA